MLLEGVEFREEEVTLVAEEPLLGNDVGVLLVGVPVKVPRFIERLQTDGTGDAHAAEARLLVDRGSVGLEDRHSGQVHFAGGAHQPSVDDVLQVHLFVKTIR